MDGSALVRRSFYRGLHPDQEFQPDKIVSSLYSDERIVAHTPENVLDPSNATQNRRPPIFGPMRS